MKNLPVQITVTAADFVVTPGVVTHIREYLQRIRITHPRPFTSGVSHCRILPQNQIQPCRTCQITQSSLMRVITLAAQEILQLVPGIRQTKFATAVSVRNTPEFLQYPGICHPG